MYRSMCPTLRACSITGYQANQVKGVLTCEWFISSLLLCVRAGMGRTLLQQRQQRAHLAMLISISVVNSAQCEPAARTLAQTGAFAAAATPAARARGQRRHSGFLRSPAPHRIAGARGDAPPLAGACLPAAASGADAAAWSPPRPQPASPPRPSPPPALPAPAAALRPRALPAPPRTLGDPAPPGVALCARAAQVRCAA